MTPADAIMKILTESKVVPSGFTGQVVLNVGQGAISSVERWEKNGLMQNLKGMNEVSFMRILQDFGRLANNML